jgi:dUTP pyrophosphatase
MKVKIKRLREDAVVPKYAKVGDAAMDVTAVSKVVKDNYVEYGTGLAFEVPVGYVMLMFPRSSNTKSDLIMGNCVGVLDSGYRGELIIRFNAIGERNHYEVGDRIAQVMILPYPEIEFKEVESLSKSVRGEGRFGSTGR